MLLSWFLFFEKKKMEGERKTSPHMHLSLIWNKDRGWKVGV